MVAERTICLSTLCSVGVNVDSLVGSTNNQAHEHPSTMIFHDMHLLMHSPLHIEN